MAFDNVQKHRTLIETTRARDVPFRGLARREAMLPML
jgi:hypothetical protein